MTSAAHLRLSCLIATAALALLLAIPAPAGTLPEAVNGQPLPSLAPMLARVSPAVVNISSTSHRRVAVNPFFSDPIMRQFFGLPAVPPSRELVQQSLGSGVIVDAKQGYILTNNHVIAGADEIQVTLTDGKSYKAKLIGTDPQTDLAVIQIQAPGLVALPLADSSKLRVGDFVVAVGDPFGLGQSATSGIVSGLQRQDLRRSGVQNYIQTDASINPGNSGGALVNLDGALVGINSMIYSPSGASAGLGFAIPSDLASEVMQQLIAHGKVVRGSLGVDAQDLSSRVAAALGIKATRGALITNVMPDSPAAKAGLKPGDLVTSVNGKPITDAQDLRNVQGLAPLGSTLALGVDRGGRALTIDAKLTAVSNQADGASLDARLAGATLVDAPAGDDQGVEGVTIETVATGSRAARNGLAGGDIVVGVNNVATPDLAQLRRVFALHPRVLVLSLVREGQLVQIQIGG
ncbi:MAG: Do family serine endopeptidase [Xanthomonadales bacterium]|nr:Do family serine endopeptidase [Xanthomonadales bacterium]ODU93206.1 MAG: heat-shock protein [Rhodanobacter sp. SCN 66-43]OJY82110.1 MAG: heat-shock protein [Xanthomonadales bacterium 66-474]